VEECTYFWGVNTSWGINTAKSKRPLNQEDNQAPQPTHQKMGSSSETEERQCQGKAVTKWINYCGGVGKWTRK
jgi:hypothetical protein